MTGPANRAMLDLLAAIRLAESAARIGLKPMSQSDITKLCHQYGIKDSVIIREIIAVARAFDGSINRQYREVIEYIKAIRELV